MVYTLDNNNMLHIITSLLTEALVTSISNERVGGILVVIATDFVPLVFLSASNMSTDNTQI